MAVVYYKICRELIKQNRYMKNVLRMFKSSETKCAWLFLQYPEICPKSTNFPCLSHYRPICYAIGNIPTTVYFILKSITGENHFLMKYVWIANLARVLTVAGSSFSKSSHIWKIGQKIAHILETLAQEETEITRKLIRQFL